MKILSYGLIILTLCQVGCGSTNIQNGLKIDSHSVKNIRTGKTTRSEIIQMFGQPPNRQSTGGGNEVWIYQYSQYQDQPLVTNFIPIANMFAAGANSHHENQVLNVQFAGDIVSTCTYTNSNMNISASSGILGSHSNPNQTNTVSTPCNEAE